MASRACAEMIRQILDGMDIPVPEKMLKISSSGASARDLAMPYSILENLAHTVYWQDIWLLRLSGKKKSVGMKEWTEDWQTPSPSDWDSYRARFLAGLGEALMIAESEPFDHAMNSDEEAEKTLIQIAVHAAYHCGQINLLKRAQKLKK